MSQPGTLTWFAAHELRLSWRDWLSMMTAGRRWRARSVAVALVVVGVVMHVIAYAMVGPYAATGATADTVPLTTLATITGCAPLSWSLMASQAMESVTRAFYTRSDLDLILSSPVAAQRLFAVRIATMAGGITLMSVLVAAPFVDMLALRGGAHWLAAYPVAAAMGATAAAFAVALTVALFRLIGPKRTRLIAQIVAAVIGAGFVIGLQLGAIVSYGTLSRTAYLSSSTLVAHVPGADSPFWWPARAMLGDLRALAAVMIASLALLLAAVAIFSRSFAAHAVAAQSIGQGVGLGVRSGTARAHRAGGFRVGSPGRALRRKEWVLLRRDPWLVSQTLMQLLYLLPPAFMLWKSFGDGASALVLLVPVLVMGSGQLAGGLAWLAISGEDAPDLVATAPVVPRAIMQAKIEAVLGGVALVFAPFLVGLALAAPYEGAVAAIGVALAASSATAVQFWFRAQAKRSHFRRRQTSSRMATFAEAFASITWAATAALAAAGLSIAVLPAICAVGVLALARWMRPKRM